MTSPSIEALTPRYWAALTAALLLILLPGFFSIPTMDRDEARYSQAATQMMETGDYVDIRFQDQDRYVKPAGIYWMQVATAAPFGGPNAPIWAYRLPSLIGIIGAALVTAWLGTRLAGRRVGVIAGIVLGTTLAAAVEARTAKTDAMLLLSAVVAQAALYFMLVKAPPGSRLNFVGAPLIFWAATGASLMIKGPIVAMVSGTTILAFAAWQRDWKLLGRLRLLPGLAVAAAISLPWIIAITVQTDGAFLEKSVGHALLGKVAESDDSHAGPFGYHTLLLPVTFWPGAMLLGLGTIWAWRTRGEATTRFLLAWILPTWLIFEIVATKLPHYTLPAFPALALLAALGANDYVTILATKAGRWAHRIALGLFVVVAVIIAALPFIAARELGEPVVKLWHVATAIVAVTTALFAIVAARQPRADTLLRITGLAALTMAITFGGVVPSLTKLWPSYEVAQRLAATAGCDDRPLSVATAGYKEPSNVFWLGTATRLANDGAGAAAHLTGPCTVAVVDSRERATFDAAAGALGLKVRSLGVVEGTNAVKGREMALDILVIADSPLEATSQRQRPVRQ